MRAKLRVFSGGSSHRSGGETSSPSQVYRRGIGCPYSKAALFKGNDGSSGEGVGEGFAHAVKKLKRRSKDIHKTRRIS
jgi:hypothetical protein